MITHYGQCSDPRFNVFCYPKHKATSKWAHKALSDLQRRGVGQHFYTKQFVWSIDFNTKLNSAALAILSFFHEI